MQPAYESFPTAAVARNRNSISYAVSPYGINLPSALSLTEEQVVFVASKLKMLLGGA
jgi:perosamine synthetase